ncbi:uncharacterized protein KQ657_000249 [Scheffersomyces spartinae]|uniref:PRA1 family protein n=1 Tax=Scheffersomyces spartinae TaxID=45513 RepID=A0A9P7VE08_9ASCO|nr:uncharacterized protein KQ657_000249 [Scheffersomyces spartinae]KAG7196236.1 hypothetical protein KQ657_000249 [Scheffersomyces spartinae]
MSISLGNFASFADRLNLERIRSDVGTISSSISKLRPPQEFFDIRRISKPANFGEIQSRVTYNLGYFSANYLAVVLMFFIYCLATNLLLLFVIVIVGGGIYGINKLGGQDLVLPVGRFNTSQLYTGLLIVAVPLGFLAGPIYTMLWLVGASAVTVFSHASLMEKPIETIFEEEV